MTDAESSVNLIWLVVVLVLAVSALAVHRISPGLFVRALLGWGAIIGVVVMAVTYRAQIEAFVQRTAERFGLGEQSVAGETVRIAMSDDGHFWARVTLNGFSRRMLVDSGATITALTPETARNAGVEARSGGFPVVINTANGRIVAEHATVERLSIGPLETRDIAAVVSPAFGSTDVLGMNFLSRLGSWRVEGRTLILEPSTGR